MNEAGRQGPGRLGRHTHGGAPCKEPGLKSLGKDSAVPWHARYYLSSLAPRETRLPFRAVGDHAGGQQSPLPHREAPTCLLPLAILDAPSKTVRQPFYSGGASRPAPDPPHSGVSTPLLLGGVAGAGTLFLRGPPTSGTQDHPHPDTDYKSKAPEIPSG